MRSLAAALVVLAAAACAAPPPPEEGPPPDPRVIRVHDLRDLVGPPGASPPAVFESPEALVRWAHGRLDRSCWCEGVPEVEWRASPGVLVVRAVPEAQERLAAGLAAVRGALAAER